MSLQAPKDLTSEDDPTTPHEPDSIGRGSQEERNSTRKPKRKHEELEDEVHLAISPESQPTVLSLPPAQKASVHTKVSSSENSKPSSRLSLSQKNSRKDGSQTEKTPTSQKGSNEIGNSKKEKEKSNISEGESSLLTQNEHLQQKNKNSQIETNNGTQGNVSENKKELPQQESSKLVGVDTITEVNGTAPSSSNNNKENQKCFVCNKSLLHLNLLDREKHVNDCLDCEKQSDSEDFKSGMYICDICNKDISSYDIERRNQHVLICCDRFQKEHVLDIVIGPTQPESSDVQSIVFICPFCSKDLSNNVLKSRISHLKNCSKKAKEKTKENPIVVDSPLPKEVLSNKSNTVPTVTEVTAPKKHKKHKNKSEKKVKVVKSKFFENQPPVSPPKILSKYKRNTSEAEPVKPKKKVSKKKSRDENLDLAMAMSESVYLVEKEKREDEELLNKQLEISKKDTRPKTRSEVISELFGPTNAENKESSTPQFAESALSKKYGNSLLHKKQVESIYESQTSNVKNVAEKNKERESILFIRPDGVWTDVQERRSTKLQNTSVVQNEVNTKEPVVFDNSQLSKEEKQLLSQEAKKKREDDMVTNFQFAQPKPKTKQTTVIEDSDSDEHKLVFTDDDDPIPPNQNQSLRDFVAESKQEILFYEKSCKEKREEMERKIKQIQEEYYAEIGKLSIEKDARIKELQKKYEIPKGSILLEVHDLSQESKSNVSHEIEGGGFDISDSSAEENQI